MPRRSKKQQLRSQQMKKRHGELIRRRTEVLKAKKSDKNNGVSEMERACEVMGEPSHLTTPTPTTPGTPIDLTFVATEKVTSHFEDCAQIIFSYYQKELNRLPGEDGILDIDVSFDGELYVYKYIMYFISG